MRPPFPITTALWLALPASAGWALTPQGIAQGWTARMEAYNVPYTQSAEGKLDAKPSTQAPWATPARHPALEALAWKGGATGATDPLDYVLERDAEGNVSVNGRGL